MMMDPPNNAEAAERMKRKREMASHLQPRRIRIWRVRYKTIARAAWIERMPARAAINAASANIETTMRIKAPALINPQIITPVICISVVK